MPIALIVAMSENNVIGKDNKMPWHLPDELRYFKSITIGKPIIMGRKTFQSIGKPLPERTNIVITTNSDFNHTGIVTVPALEQALAFGQECVSNSDQDEIMVIGGAYTYQQALPLATRVYLTRIHRHIEGDTFFPTLSNHQWRETSRQDKEVDANNPIVCSYLIYERIAQESMS